MGKHCNREKDVGNNGHIHVNRPKTGTDNPWGNLFSQKYKSLVNLLIFCKVSHFELLCNSVSHSNVQAFYYDHAVK